MPSRFIAANQVKLDDGSVVDRAAYNGRLRLVWQAGGKVLDHTHRGDWAAGGLEFPPEAGPVPPECEAFWNLVDANSPPLAEYGAIDLLLGLPLREELCSSEHRALVKAFVAPIVAAGHPVQWDMHAPRTPKALHAHVLVSIRGITPDRRIVPISGSPYLPIVRGGNRRRSWFVPNWGSHWLQVQEAFFQSRGIPLRVPAAARVPGWRPPSGPSYGEGLSAVDREDYRRERTRHFEDDDNVIAALMRDRFTFDKTDIEAVLALSFPDLEPLRLRERVTSILGRVKAVPRGGRRFTTDAALKQLDSFCRNLDILGKASFAAPPIADEGASSIGTGNDDAEAGGTLAEASDDLFVAESNASRIAVLVGATRDALVDRTNHTAVDGALPALIEAYQPNHRITIVVPDLTARARLGKLADRRDVRCHALAGWLASNGASGVTARRRSMRDVLILFDAQNTDDLALRRLVEVVVEGKEKLVLVIDESDIPRPGCGALARFAADEYAGATVQDPNRQGSYNRIGIVAATRTASRTRIGFALQSLADRLTFEAAMPAGDEPKSFDTSSSTDPSHASSVISAWNNTPADAALAAAATVITGSEADAGWRPSERTPMTTAKLPLQHADPDSRDELAGAFANDRAFPRSGHGAAGEPAFELLGRDGRPLQPGDLVVATRLIDPRDPDGQGFKASIRSSNLPSQEPSAAPMSTNSNIDRQRGRVASPPIEFGTRLRISHVDAARRLVTLDLGRTVLETLTFEEMPVPMAKAGCLPLRYARAFVESASKHVPSRPLPNPRGEWIAVPQIIVNVRSLEHAGELLDFAIYSKAARIVIAPEVARSGEELQKRLYHFSPAGVLHAIVSALSGRTIARRTDAAPKISTPNPSHGSADASPSLAEMDVSIGANVTDEPTPTEADSTATGSGERGSGNVGPETLKAALISPASGDAASRVVAATDTAPLGSAPDVRPTVRRSPRLIEAPDVSAERVPRLLPALPGTVTSNAPGPEETSAGDEGLNQRGAVNDAGEPSFKLPARENNRPNQAWNRSDEDDASNRTMDAKFSLPDEFPLPVENMQPAEETPRPIMKPAIQPPIVAPDVNHLTLDREVQDANKGDFLEEEEPGEEQDYRDREDRNEEDFEDKNEDPRADAEEEVTHDEDNDPPSELLF